MDLPRSMFLHCCATSSSTYFAVFTFTFAAMTGSNNRCVVSNQTGCLEWVAVAENASPDGFWSIVLQNIYVGSSSVLRSPVAAIFDTGTSMIVGPFSDVAYLAEEIGATCVYFTGIDSSSVEPVRTVVVAVVQQQCRGMLAGLAPGTARMYVIRVTRYGRIYSGVVVSTTMCCGWRSSMCATVALV